MRIRRPLALAVSPLFLAVSLTACSSDDADVCSDMDALKSSIDNVKDVQLAENGLNELSDGLNQVEDDLDQLVSDAKAQFGDEIGAVTTAVDNLKGAIAGAKSDLDKASFTDVATSLRAVDTSITNLDQTVQSSC
jgi:hypothetical protein